MTAKPDAFPASYQFVFDGNDCVRFAADGDPLGTDLDFTVNDYSLAVAFGSALPPELADLVDIAVAVYVVDRLARRRPEQADLYHLYWTRQFKVRLPVRMPGRWINTALGERLHRVLRFLTDDVWQFEFVARRGNGRASETTRALLRAKPIGPVTVGLFSGGLDSLAGACHELLNPSGGTFVLFSGRTSSRVGWRQEILSHQLSMRTRRDVHPLVVEFGLRNRARCGPL